MLARALMLLLATTSIAPPPSPRSRPPVEVRFMVRDSLYNGRPMSSGLSYATVLPVVAHRLLPLGTLVRLRASHGTVDGIVLDNEILPRAVDLALSPFLVRRLGLLPDEKPWVTMEVVGCEPRSRWIHAIGALSQPS
jgi:hypothetical protein